MATIANKQLFIIANVSSYILQLYKAAIIRWWIHSRLEFINVGFVTPVLSFLIRNNMETVRQYSHYPRYGCLLEPKHVAI